MAIHKGKLLPMAAGDGIGELPITKMPGDEDGLLFGFEQIFCPCHAHALMKVCWCVNASSQPPPGLNAPTYGAVIFLGRQQPWQDKYVAGFQQQHGACVNAGLSGRQACLQPRKRPSSGRARSEKSSGMTRKDSMI